MVGEVDELEEDVGELVVLGTRLLSDSAHGCCLLNLREGEEQKEVLEAKDDEEKESEVDGEVEEREIHSTCACDMMNEAQTRILSHSVICKESNEDDTKETLRTNKQRALTSIQVLFS